MDTTISTSFIQKSVLERRQMINRLKTKAALSRTKTEKVADWITKSFGSLFFLLINIAWFTIWIAINLGLVPFITPFDPFPFGFLTMTVSLEAILLTTFVLISQSRIEAIDNLREDIDLHFDIITEEELTKVMQIVVLIAKKNNIDLSKDQMLDEMLKPIDLEKIEKTLEKNFS